MSYMKDFVASKEEMDSFFLRGDCGPQIITKHEPIPVPWSNCDWSAVTDYYDGGDPMGWGSTEEEAIADLREQLCDVCHGAQEPEGCKGPENCIECEGSGYLPGLQDMPMYLKKGDAK